MSIVSATGRVHDTTEGVSVESTIARGSWFLVVILILATVCLAQEGLTIHSKGKQRWPATEPQKIYLSVCSVVQREFGRNDLVAPRVTLVLSAAKNEVGFDEREIRLTKWDRYLFAQGVVTLASEDVIRDRRTAMAQRAVTWVDATVDIKGLAK